MQQNVQLATHVELQWSCYRIGHTEKITSWTLPQSTTKIWKKNMSRIEKIPTFIVWSWKFKPISVLRCFESQNCGNYGNCPFWSYLCCEVFYETHLQLPLPKFDQATCAGTSTKPPEHVASLARRLLKVWTPLALLRQRQALSSRLALMLDEIPILWDLE